MSNIRCYCAKKSLIAGEYWKIFVRVGSLTISLRLKKKEKKKTIEPCKFNFIRNSLIYIYDGVITINFIS
jgi:hypothetical protein